MKLRVVFDTTTVVSALLFRTSRLAWLSAHWQAHACVPLISRETAAELIRVLGYPKFRLSADYRREVLAEYLPNCEIVETTRRCPLVCRDRSDQPFLNLAHSGNADLLVSGDGDVLALRGKTKFLIESPAEYRVRTMKP